MERQPINGELGATMDELNEGIADLNQGMEEMEGLWMEFDRVKRILTGTSGDRRESLVHMLVVTLLVAQWPAVSYYLTNGTDKTVVGAFRAPPGPFLTQTA